MSAKKSHYAIFDVYRGFAAIAVLLFHFASRHDPGFLFMEGDLDYFSLGHYGVQFFFVISGYFMMHTASSTTTATSFLINRVSRLWPPLVACSGITFLMLSIFELPGRERTFLDLLASNLMLTDFFGQWVDGVYWSLLVEVKYYILFGLVYFHVPDRVLTALAAFYFLSALLRFLGDITNMQIWSVAADVLMISQHLPWFLLGALFFLISTPRLGVSLITCVAVFLVEIWLQDWNLELLTLWLLCAALMFFALRLKSFTLPYAVRFLGVISYPMYLLHQYIGFIVIRELNGVFGSDWAKILISFSIVVVMSYLVHRFVEREFTHSLKRYLRKKLLKESSL